MPMRQCRRATLLREGLTARDGRMLAGPLRPEEDAILGIDETMLFPAPLFAAGTAGSTFDLAWELASSHAFPPWSAVIAVSQTHGRGQMRREWHSPPGNLHVSFFLPAELIRLENMAPLAAGVMVCEALRHRGIPVSLKWPNDILLAGEDGREGKFGGILLEEKKGKIVAGLGLNLRSAPDSGGLRPDHAVRAGVFPGSAEPVGSFWLTMARRMREYHQRTMEGASPEAIRVLAERFLAWKGRRVHAVDSGATGTVSGLAPDGSLVLEADARVVLISSGSVVPLG